MQNIFKKMGLELSELREEISKLKKKVQHLDDTVGLKPPPERDHKVIPKRKPVESYSENKDEEE